MERSRGKRNRVRIRCQESIPLVGGGAGKKGKEMCGHKKGKEGCRRRVRKKRGGALRALLKKREKAEND